MKAPSRFAMGLVGDNMAVADAGSGQVTFLNASASLVWLSLIESERSEDELFALFDWIDPHARQSRNDAVRNILREFKSLGWADIAGGSAWRMTGGRHSRIQWTPCKPREIALHTQRWSRQVRVSNATILFQIEAEAGSDPNGDFARLTRFLEGFALDCSARPDAALSLAIRAGEVAVSDGGKTASFKDFQTASGVLLRLAIEHSYPDAKDHTTFHAGALCGPKGAILMPAVSGAGKTTLTGFLVARGWRYCGDDVVGAGRVGATGEIHILPFPTALGVKGGSVDILRPFFPSIEDVSPVAYGAKSVRFLTCDQERGPIREDWRKLRALVFPTYDKQSALHLEAISETDALRLILQSGWGNGAEFERTSFGLLIEAVNCLPRYRLRYASLDAAAAALEGLS
jgi:hypothetical protein